MNISDKRSDIIQAALELIAERGFHGAPMAEIAEKAGVAAGTIYRYFENKDILITEMYQDLKDKIIIVLQEGYPFGRPVRERFLHLTTTLLRYFITHPLGFRYLEQYHNSPYGVSLRRDMVLDKPSDIDIFKKLFEEDISQQALKDLPLPMLFSLAFGPLIDLARGHVLNFITLDDEMIIKTMEACWDGIKK